MEEEDEQRKLQEKDSISFCPSFNSYSSDKFADIAAKVSQEFNRDNKLSTNDDSIDLEDDDDFEFSLVQSDPDASADEIFYDGRDQVHPIFPIFDRTLLLHDDDDDDDGDEDRDSNRSRLKNLFIGERDDQQRDPPSCSSSEADELEAIPPGTYCVWRPKLIEASPSRCVKSNSTGSASKRWKFRDLLRRCNSEGRDDKESFVFLTPKNGERKGETIEKIENPKEIRGIPVKVAGKLKAKGHSAAAEKASPPSPSPHEVFYVRNKALKESGKRKSYLPYRQDLFGLFANVNGLNRTFPPPF